MNYTDVNDKVVAWLIENSGIPADVDLELSGIIRHDDFGRILVRHTFLRDNGLFERYVDFAKTITL